MIKMCEGEREEKKEIVEERKDSKKDKNKKRCRVTEDESDTFNKNLRDRQK